MNTPWLQLEEIQPDKYILRIQMGKQNFVYKNITRLDAHGIARRYLIEEIRKYINHRNQIIKRFGGSANESRLKSLKRLEYAFGGSTVKWKFEQLPRIVLNWSDDLVNIAPGVKSKFYKSQSQFLLDLISWATNQMKYA